MTLLLGCLKTPRSVRPIYKLTGRINFSPPPWHKTAPSSGPVVGRGLTARLRGGGSGGGSGGARRLLACELRLRRLERELQLAVLGLLRGLVR